MDAFKQGMKKGLNQNTVYGSFLVFKISIYASFCIMCVFKVQGVIDWPWMVVTAPLWGFFIGAFMDGLISAIAEAALDKE